MPSVSPLDEVEPPRFAAAYTAAAGVLYMLSGALLLAEALYNGLSNVALTCVVLLIIGLVIVWLGLDLLTNPFRHRALGEAICVFSVLAFVTLLIATYSSSGGEVVLVVLPVGGVVAGVSAILYESPGLDKRR